MIAAGAAGRAHAQQTDCASVDCQEANAGAGGPDAYAPLSYDRGANTSVLQKPRPEYEATGIRSGGLLIYPKLDTAVAYDDNIYAVKSGAVGDAVFTAAPEINVQSDWPRNSVSARIWARQDWYEKHSSENAVQYGGDLAGKFEFGQSTITGEVASGKYVMPRSESVNIGGAASLRRIAYTVTKTDEQFIHEFSRVRLSASVDYERYGYENGQASGGGLVFNKTFDHDTLVYTGRAEFAVTPDAALYLRTAGNRQIYSNAAPMNPFSRNSSGYNIDAGGDFDFTHLMRGEIQVGYMSQHYASHLFKSIAGPSVQAKLEWFPSRTTTVTAQASRAISDAVTLGTAGIVTTDSKIQIDHELRYNVIVSASGRVGQDRYNGIDRNDNHTGAEVSANWLLNRRLGLKFAYAHTEQRSSGIAKGPSFSDNRGMLCAVLQF
jgi:hypothetical protein